LDGGWRSRHRDPRCGRRLAGGRVELRVVAAEVVGQRRWKGRAEYPIASGGDEDGTAAVGPDFRPVRVAQVAERPAPGIEEGARRPGPPERIGELFEQRPAGGVAEQGGDNGVRVVIGGGGVSPLGVEVGGEGAVESGEQVGGEPRLGFLPCHSGPADEQEEAAADENDGDDHLDERHGRTAIHVASPTGRYDNRAARRGKSGVARPAHRQDEVMAIAVTCQSCGKSFKAKDELAGKAVRCPGCHQPLRIPGAGKSPAAVGAASSGGGKSAVDEAIAKVEAARKKREAEAAQNTNKTSEVMKLVEEFDKVAPKAKEKEAAAARKPPGTPEAKLGEKPKSVTAIDKAADRVGMLKGTLAWKYVVIVVLLAGGATGSALLIQKIMHGTAKVTTPTQVGEKEIEQLYQQAEEAAAAQNWSKVRDCLEQIKLAASWRVNNIRYKKLKAHLEKAVGGG
jgi:hypothetical protein